MDVKLYKITDDSRVVSKTLGDATVVKCVARDTIDVLRPVLTISASHVADYNYMYIERYGRYYFIKKVETFPNGKWTISGEVDVLMTYADQIKTLTGTVDRQEFLRNGYLADSMYKAKSYKAIVTKAFPNGLTNDSFILMTVG